LPKSKDKTDLFQTGSDIKQITKLDTTPKEDTGEEPNLKYIDQICMIYLNFILIVIFPVWIMV
jgi:hypothetical protein